MYVANGAMLAAWDAPGGIRPTQRWQLNVDEVLAVSGVIDSTLSLGFRATGLHVVSEEGMGAGEDGRIGHTSSVLVMLRCHCHVNNFLRQPVTCRAYPNR